MTQKTALDYYAPDMRRIRSDALANSIMRAIDEFIMPDDRRYAMRAVLNLLFDEGWDLVTDEQRANAGLEPRGEKGWTNRELHIMENARQLAMIQSLARPVMFPFADEAKR